MSRSMKPALLYRIAAVLLVLFAAGHTFGFLQVDPEWHVDTLVQSMKTTHFDIAGSERTYWDFFVGFGLFVTVFQLFATIVAWQFGGLPRETLAAMRVSLWAFALTFAVIAFLSLRYFFIVPVVFSIVIFLCLAGAAWLSGAKR